MAKAAPKKEEKETAVDLIPKSGKLTTEVPDFIDTVRHFLAEPRHRETVAVLEKMVARDILVQ